MRKIVCPRCGGEGEIQEDVTNVGLGPFQDRPSTVNDDAWELPVHPRDEPTRVVRVPHVPRTPRPPMLYKPDSSPSQRPTMVQKLELPKKQPRVWPGLLLFLLLGVLVGMEIMDHWSDLLFWSRRGVLLFRG